jgi:hypothetical protein
MFLWYFREAVVVPYYAHLGPGIISIALKIKRQGIITYKDKMVPSTLVSFHLAATDELAGLIQKKRTV